MWKDKRMLYLLKGLSFNGILAQKSKHLLHLIAFNQVSFNSFLAWSNSMFLRIALCKSQISLTDWGYFSVGFEICTRIWDLGLRLWLSTATWWQNRNNSCNFKLSSQCKSTIPLFFSLTNSWYIWCTSIKSTYRLIHSGILGSFILSIFT